MPKQECVKCRGPRSTVKWDRHLECINCRTCTELSPCDVCVRWTPSKFKSLTRPKERTEAVPPPEVGTADTAGPPVVAPEVSLPDMPAPAAASAVPGVNEISPGLLQAIVAAVRALPRDEPEVPSQIRPPPQIPYIDVGPQQTSFFDGSSVRQRDYDSDRTMASLSDDDRDSLREQAGPGEEGLQALVMRTVPAVLSFLGVDFTYREPKHTPSSKRFSTFGVRTPFKKVSSCPVTPLDPELVERVELIAKESKIRRPMPYSLSSAFPVPQKQFELYIAAPSVPEAAKERVREDQNLDPSRTNFLKPSESRTEDVLTSVDRAARETLRAASMAGYLLSFLADPEHPPQGDSDVIALLQQIMGLVVDQQATISLSAAAARRVNVLGATDIAPTDFRRFTTSDSFGAQDLFFGSFSQKEDKWAREREARRETRARFPQKRRASNSRSRTAARPPPAPAAPQQMQPPPPPPAQPMQSQASTSRQASHPPRGMRNRGGKGATNRSGRRYYNVKRR
ncbi:uncharacterized protein [Antedon mediterranea]|uniref:uncharacterized protein n=1 Tax=Antedon mediterranea TaxID=105859 RepID=UPI003AF684F0